MYNVLDGLDLTMIELIEYFLGLFAYFNGVGKGIAIGIGAVGIIWSGFQMMNSRLQVKEFFYGTIFKWFLFIVFFTIYPIIMSSVPLMAAHYGTAGGKGEEMILTQLSTFRSNLEQEIKSTVAEKKLLASKELNEVFQRNRLVPKLLADNSIQSMWRDYVDNNNELAKEYILEAMKGKGKKTESYRQQLEEAKKKLYKQNVYKTSTEKARIIDIIRQIMIPATQLDGVEIVYEDGENLVSNYVKLNLWLINSDGDPYPYFSPNTLFSLGVLCCEIAWRKVFTDVMDDQNQDPSTQEESKKKMGFFNINIKPTLLHIVDIIMALIICIAIMASTIFALIQYIMCVMEWCIICGIGVLYIPFILFDGTKEMPKKLVPVFTSFLIKLLVMNICMIFVYYIYINFTIDQITGVNNLSWSTVGTTLFSVLLGFILTQNAPQIAVTLTTGQPQMSMGEAIHAMATVAGIGYGAARAGHAARNAANSTMNAGRDVLNHGTDIAGKGARIFSAGNSAYNEMRNSGEGIGSSLLTGLKASGSTATRTAWEDARQTGAKWLHGGKNGSGGGGGAEASHGNNRQYDKNGSNEQSTRFNNSSYSNATKDIDDGTGRLVQQQMTHKEFMQEKLDQGASIGREYAQAALAKKEKRYKDDWKNSVRYTKPTKE